MVHQDCSHVEEHLCNVHPSTSLQEQTPFLAIVSHTKKRALFLAYETIAGKSVCSCRPSSSQMLLCKWLQTPSDYNIQNFKATDCNTRNPFQTEAYTTQVYTISNIHLHLVIQIAHKEQTNVNDVSSSDKDSASNRIVVLQILVEAKNFLGGGGTLHWILHLQDTTCW